MEKNKTRKICFVIVYIGFWPEWMNYFLKSCEYNPDIDWLIIGNKKPSFKKPRNVRFVTMEKSDLSRLIEEKLKMKVNIKNPYKFCDFKPAYGKIFEDYLKKYDFWGHGDLDMIYGNIKKFITKEDLEKYDLITTKKNYITGQFTLFKNCPMMNTFYEKTKNYKNVFKNEKHIGFDEWNQSLFKDHPSEEYFENSENIYSMTHAIKFYSKRGELKALFKNLVLEDVKPTGLWKVKFNQGKIKKGLLNKEYTYFHFIKYKKKLKVEKVNQVPHKFAITKLKIYTKYESDILERLEEERKYFKKNNKLETLIKLIEEFLTVKKDIYIGKIGLIIKRKNPKMYYILKKRKPKILEIKK